MYQNNVLELTYNQIGFKNRTVYICFMAIFRKTINGLPLVMESKELAPNILIYMISIQGDPIQFPMVYKKENGGWIFVDKMTLLEFMEREKEISDAIEAMSK